MTAYALRSVEPARRDQLAAALAAGAVRDEPTVAETGEARPVPIDGVTVQRVPCHADGRGDLIPFLDTRSAFWAEPVVYAYCFTVRPGRIKGWGMHDAQTDRYFVSHSRLRVALLDGRETSRSYGRTHDVWFTPATPGLIAIPPGVWHADQNWGDADAVVLNFPTRPYDPDEPDKYRIDPHSGVIPYDWSLRDG